MKTKTITAESPELLDTAIIEEMKAFQDHSKVNHSQIGVMGISFSTHIENEKPVYCSQILYVEQSKFAIGNNKLAQC